MPWDCGTAVLNTLAAQLDRMTSCKLSNHDLEHAIIAWCGSGFVLPVSRKSQPLSETLARLKLIAESKLASLIEQFQSSLK